MQIACISGLGRRSVKRQRLVEALKSLPLTVTGTRPISEAIVTAGGVSVKEIDPKTMESKIVPGLYFAGEVIDIDAVEVATVR